MKIIALTGHPVAQQAAALHLRAMVNGRNLPVTVRTGIVAGAQAYIVHEAGGEIWHCGPATPGFDLQGGLIDRTLPVVSFDDLAPHVQAFLDQFLTKTPITGEAHHG